MMIMVHESNNYIILLYHKNASDSINNIILKVGGEYYIDHQSTLLRLNFKFPVDIDFRRKQAKKFP